MNIKETAEKTVRWYNLNKRPLPWRDTGNPYDVWIAEIMLQQTRIPVILERFPRFLQHFPDLVSLAEAPKDEVFKEWEGLGYYQRAANLKKCAETVVREYGGVFPSSSAELRNLPGIGPYTAAAIASIVSEEKVPLIDGNVKRVISRLYGIEDDIRSAKAEADIREILEEGLENLYGKDIPSFNVGLMELGEVICVPGGHPFCEKCPLAEQCVAHQTDRTDKIPYTAPKKKRKAEEKTVLILSDKEAVYLKKRPDKGLLAGLYEPVVKDGSLSEEEVRKLFTEEGCDIAEIRPLGKAVHVFSHREWHMTGYRVTLRKPAVKDGLIRVTKEKEKQYAVPSAFSAYRQYFWTQEEQDGQ